jgi:DNA polymerase-3 subunit gamma/tau
MIAWNRKYRPGKFSDLDQEKIREVFLRILKTGKFPQAYLMAGPKGTGKTSTARILAMTLNCELNEQLARGMVKGESVTGTWKEPCLTCSTCVAIKNGSSPSVTEIDAASNRGIDDIRSLREKVGYIPSGGMVAVFIIDEVHMLTTEAFNALLKTLEEPPAHAVFCLCTTEEQKLPATITSRCTKFKFSKATDLEIMHSLKRVVDGEKLKVDEAALRLIAGKADGSFRDGVKLLEQLATLPEITEEAINKELGNVGAVEVRLYETMKQKDIKSGLDLIDIASKNGADMKGLAKAVLILASSELKKEAIEKGMVKQELLELVEVISKAFARFSEVPIPALPLEMAVVEWGLRGGAPGVSIQKSVVRENTSIKQSVLSIKQNIGARSSELGARELQKSVFRSQESEEVGKSVSVGESVNPARLADDQGSDETSPNPLLKGEGSMVLDENKVRDRWREIMVKVGEANHGLETILRTTRVFGCEGEMLKLAVGYKFHKERLEQDKYLLILEKIVGEVIGTKVLIRVVLEEKAKSVPKKEENITAVIHPEDKALVETVEEVFGV